MSSSSSSDELTYTQRLVRENIEEFRAYSLDPDLIENFYNKGDAGPETHPEPEGGSSSSSGYKATIRITLVNKTKSFLDPEEKLPDDLQFHVYDQGGTTVSPSKTPGEDEATVEVEGEWPVSFQLNIEHPAYREARIRFVVPEPGQYLHQIGMGIRTANQKRRITQDYKEYLLQWLQQFWSLRDQGQDSLIPDFLPPAPDQPLDPFAHARSKLLNQYPQNLAVASTRRPSAVKSLASAAKQINLDKRNFLGVRFDIWRCIVGVGVDNNQGRLYKNVDPIKYSEGGDERLDDPDEWAPDRGFNCRAFTVAAARYLRSQLQSVCPDANVSHLLVENHALLYVDLGSTCPQGDDCGDCCKKSFVYEPQTGETWDSPEEISSFEEDTKAYMEDHPSAEIPERAKEEDGSDWINQINRVDWDEFPEEVERISGIVCGCLQSRNALGPETYIKQKCEDGTFGEWFKENFKSGPGLTTTTDPNMPQALECSTPRTCSPKGSVPINPETGEPDFDQAECGCIEDEKGYISEGECASYCNRLYACSDSECPLVCTARPEGHYPGRVSIYADKQECLESCNDKTKTLRFM